MSVLSRGYIFVDCEAWGGSPRTGQLTEFGAVEFDAYFERGEWVTHHGLIVKSRPSLANPAVPERVVAKPEEEERVFKEFDLWLTERGFRRAIFWSDNVAFDWQWISDGFWRYIGRNPFGHSGRRISDFYAGLTGDIRNTQAWKKLRITPHTHHPVDDAKGNVEAFARLLRGER